MKGKRRVGRVPFWGVVAALLVVVAVLAVAERRALFEGATGGASSGPVASGAPAASTSAASAPPSVAPPASSPVDLAEAGDLAALKGIEVAEPSSRSAEQVLALARGHQSLRRGAVQQLGREIAKQPGLAEDEETRRRLFRLAHDPEVSLEALAVISELPKPAGADLLYVLWREAPEGSARALLAEDLLRSRDVRPRASEALSLLMDLSDAKSCIARRALMPRAIEHADQRAVAALKALRVKTGCGEARDGGVGQQDCNPCLREGEWLERAIEAAEEREAPFDVESLPRPR